MSSPKAWIPKAARRTLIVAAQPRATANATRARALEATASSRAGV